MRNWWRLILFFYRAPFLCLFIWYQAGYNQSGSIEYHVERVIPHPYYRYPSTSTDVDIGFNLALVKLHEANHPPDTFMRYPICLASPKYTPYLNGETCHVTGWGLTSKPITDEDLKNVPYYLQGQNVQFTGNKTTTPNYGLIYQSTIQKCTVSIASNCPCSQTDRVIHTHILIHPCCWKIHRETKAGHFGVIAETGPCCMEWMLTIQNAKEDT